MEAAPFHLETLFSLMDTIPLGAILSDVQFRLLKFNKAAERIFGYKEEEVIGTVPFGTMIPWSVQPYMEDMIRRLREGEVQAYNVNQNITRDGRLITCEWHNARLLDEEGNFWAFLAMCRDITEERRQQKNMQILMDMLPGFAFFKNRDGSYRMASRMICDAIGKPLKEVQGKTDQDLFPPLIAAKYQEGDELIFGGSVDAYYAEEEAFYLGRKIPVTVRKVPVREEDGTISGLVGLAFDITDIKQYQEQLSASLREKELLLQEINHRVKNNLQMIIGIVQLQVGTVKDSGVISALKEVESRIRTISFVHEKLYQTESIDKIPVRELMSQLVKGVLHMAGAEERIRFAVDIPEIVFDADLALPCGLIIHELANNVVKHAFHCPQEDCCITLRMKVEEKDYVIEFEDNGRGLPEDFQKDSPDSLGLYLVQILCRHQLQGTVDISSEAGTKTIIRFPKPVES